MLTQIPSDDGDDDDKQHRDDVIKMADDDVTNTAAGDDDDDVFVRHDSDSGTTYPPRDETRAYRRPVPLSDEFQTEDQDRDDDDADTSRRGPADDTGSPPPRDETHSYSSDQRTYSVDDSISDTQPPSHTHTVLYIHVIRFHHLSNCVACFVSTRSVAPAEIQ